MGYRDVAETSIRQTQPLQETSTHVYGGIRTHNPTRQATADTGLRERGHCDRVVDRQYKRGEALLRSMRPKLKSYK